LQVDVTDEPPAEEAGRVRVRVDLADIANRFGILLAWIVVIVVFGALEPDTFLTAGNFQTIFSSQAVILLLTLGLLVSLRAGEFDLSIAGAFGLAYSLVGWGDILQGWTVWWAVALALAAGIMVGLVNSFFIIVVGLESIVVTLGSGTFFIGLAVAINGNTLGGISEKLVTPVRYPLFGISAEFYFALAVTAVIWYVFSYTPLGRYLYFVGAGRDVARLSGLPVNGIRCLSLVATSFVSALAGVVLAGDLGSTDPHITPNYLLPAFAGAFLGATAITPGRFNPWGSFIAVYFLATANTGLALQGLSGWITDVFYGASLVLAVTFSHLAGRRQVR
jgi:ribose transport system permease protein